MLSIAGPSRIGRTNTAIGTSGKAMASTESAIGSQPLTTPNKRKAYVRNDTTSGKLQKTTKAQRAGACSPAGRLHTTSSENASPFVNFPALSAAGITLGGTQDADVTETPAGDHVSEIDLTFDCDDKPMDTPGW